MGAEDPIPPQTQNQLFDCRARQPCPRGRAPPHRARAAAPTVLPRGDVGWAPSPLPPRYFQPQLLCRVVTRSLWSTLRSQLQDLAPSSPPRTEQREQLIATPPGSAGSVTQGRWQGASLAPEGAGGTAPWTRRGRTPHVSWWAGYVGATRAHLHATPRDGSEARSPASRLTGGHGGAEISSFTSPCALGKGASEGQDHVFSRAEKCFSAGSLGIRTDKAGNASATWKATAFRRGWSFQNQRERDTKKPSILPSSVHHDARAGFQGGGLERHPIVLAHLTRPCSIPGGSWSPSVTCKSSQCR